MVPPESPASRSALAQRSTSGTAMVVRSRSAPTNATKRVKYRSTFSSQPSVVRPEERFPFPAHVGEVPELTVPAPVRALSSGEQASSHLDLLLGEGLRRGRGGFLVSSFRF